MKKRSLAALCCASLVAVQVQAASRIDVVKQYADTVLDKAADHYHGDTPSPLLADGVDPRNRPAAGMGFP